MIRRPAPASSNRRALMVHAPVWTVCALGALVFVLSGEPEAHLSGRIAVGAISDAPAELITAAPVNAPSASARSAAGANAAGSAQAGLTQSSLTELPEIEPEAWPGLPPTLTGLPMAPAHAQLGASLRLRAMEASRTMHMAVAALEQRGSGKRQGADAHAARKTSAQAPASDPLAALVGKSANAVVPAGRAGSAPESPKPLAEADDGKVILPPDAADREMLIKRTAEFLARYYRRARKPIDGYVAYAFEAGQEHGVDPLLISAIMSIESSLNPKAHSNKGAKGLMQVLVAVHTEKYEPYGGVGKAYDPRASVMVGARIISDMISRTGTVEGALKHYVGAANLKSDGGYGAKVIRMRDRIWHAAHGKAVPRKIELAAAIARANLDQHVAAGGLRTAEATPVGTNETRLD
ncbi:MAG: lytic transglycosylase domain-containing protein [Burkholderiaceae bacterium]